MLVGNVVIHYGQVLLTTVLLFVFGWLWYGPIFGKKWSHEMKFTSAQMKVLGSEMGARMLWQFVGLFLFSLVLAYMAFLYGLDGFSGIVELSLLLWVGFYAASTLLNGVIWQGKSWTLFWIDGIYFLLQIAFALFVLTL